MENVKQISKENINNLRMKQLIIRFISALVILGITTFFTPNFNTSTYPILIIPSISIVLLDYLVATITGIHDIRSYRAIVSFVSCIIIVYMTQFFIPGFYISMLSATIASLMYSIIQYYLPNKE